MTRNEATEQHWLDHEEAQRAVGEARERQRDAERVEPVPSWWQRVRRAFRDARQG